MTKKIITAILFLTILLNFSSAQESLNVSLYAQYDRGEQRYSGSWVYTSQDGSEYALLGAYGGTAIYKINGPDQLEEVGYIPGPETNWREITVVGDHAYVVTDVSGEGHSMNVIRLDQLPQQATLVAEYDETFTMGHIIQKDIFSTDPYVYIAGTTETEGVHIIDVSTPSEPLEVGLYDPGYYIHDCHVSGDIMFASAFYNGFLDIVDISDKSAPQLISQIDVPDGKVHSASLTMDGKYLFVAPEQDGLPARIFNIEDPFDVFEVATYTANPLSLVHNPYILGDFAFISHNTEGLRIVDLVDPTTPVEVGYYDTWPGESGGFNGLWSACPYLPSGRIVGGNREDGLYVWEFEETYAGRLYGQVLDSLTNLPIPNAQVIFESNDTSAFSNALGEFRTGNIPGSFDITFSANGYVNKTFEFTFTEGGSDNIIIKLVPETTPTVSPDDHNILKVFPNPFSDQLVINRFDTTGGKLQIYGPHGLQLVELKAPLQSINLNSSNWPKGIYLMKWVSENGKVDYTSKLVKQ